MILSCEDKTSKSKVDKSSPYPHPEIFETPDSDREYGTDIIPDGYKIGEWFFGEWLDPSFFETAHIRCRIDRDHDSEDVGIVRLQSPEYEEKYSGNEKKPVYPVDLYMFPFINTIYPYSDITECHEYYRKWSENLIIFYELDGTDREHDDPDKKCKRVRYNLSTKDSLPVDDSTPESDEKCENGEEEFTVHSYLLRT